MIAQMKMGTLALLLIAAFLLTTTRISKAEGVVCTDDTITFVRAHFTSAIKSREPTDTLEHVPSTAERIFFYTEIQGASGSRFIYTWYHDDELVAEIPFNIMANRWRSWTSKAVDHLSTGSWTVKVVSEEGCVLHTQSLAYN